MAHESDHNDLYEKVGMLVSAMEGHEKRFDSLELRLDRSDDRIADKLDKLSEQLANTHTAVTGLKGKVAVISGAIGSVVPLLLSLIWNLIVPEHKV